MTNNEQKIKCPKCGESISIDDVLTHQIGEKIRKEIEVEQKTKEIEIASQKKDLEEQTLKFEESKKNAQVDMNKRVAEKIAAEKVTLWKQAQTEAEKQKAAEIKILEEQVKGRDEKLMEATAETLKARADRQKLEDDKKNFELEKVRQIEEERKKIEEQAFTRAVKQNEIDTFKLQRKLEEVEKDKVTDRKMLEEQLIEKESKLQEANEKELILRKEKNKLEEDKKNFEIEKQRQLDEERNKITEEASKKATEENKYFIAQLEKKLSDVSKSNEEMKRKLEQGSQQTQGEVLELELEEILKAEFPTDEILPVPKGIGGADVIHKIIDRSGRLCGQIVWESKKTKAWSEGWIQKLKDDQRAIKADLAVIVSTVLPSDVKGFSLRDGVFVCDIKLVVNLASLLRYDLMKVSEANRALSGKEEKKDVVYAYVNSTDFKQRIQSIAEAFIEMKNDIDKEKRSYQSIWAKREKQVQRVIDNTFGIYGDLKGLTGGAMQEIKMLELEEGEDRENITDENI